ncbi:hypothetical protein EW146_g4179 [Bondarzewia mesenterica]|uniref:Mitochondrial zinc maintenance protein 1, mitochondrial n=1 Tax=Bondarzewia mesenterica TaxID=1095465 RepID=A0A4S4LVA5_9AGAM|nr:hypothetical protein EW146_g4179 [Bondarzewia mesenterica]
MSISPALQAAARSAYRTLYRASASTFYGDDRVLKAFRDKMRQDTLAGLSQTDPQLYEKNVDLAWEVAEVLQKNIVQAQRVDESPTPDGQETWKLRFTKHTELADNDSIKDPQVEESNRSQRKKEKVQNSSSSSDTPTTSVPRFYSQLKKAHQQRKIPDLREEDLEESFVRVIAQTHRDTRYMSRNAFLGAQSQAGSATFARQNKLSNPGLSKSELQKARQIERERRRRKKAKKKQSAQKGTAADEHD